MQIGSHEQRVNLVTVVKIPLTSISRSSFKIRTDLGDISELMQSIEEKGIFSPIIVRRIASGTPFEVVTGSRRLEAARRLGFHEIEAVVAELDDKSVFEVFMIENLQRDTLNPLEEARAFYAYVGTKEGKCLGYGKISELARRIGKSQEYISNRIRLLRLPESLLMNLFSHKNFKVSHAEELASLAESPNRVKELTELLISNKITVKELEQTISLIKSGIETERAVELAKVESHLRVEGKVKIRDPSVEQTMLRRTKLVLESVLSYVDNAGREIEGDKQLYSQWIAHVRLKVHDAIDGVISCEKMYKKKQVSIEST